MDQNAYYQQMSTIDSDAYEREMLTVLSKVVEQHQEAEQLQNQQTRSLVVVTEPSAIKIEPNHETELGSYESGIYRDDDFANGQREPNLSQSVTWSPVFAPSDSFVDNS
jgi:hypothetical protein